MGCQVMTITAIQDRCPRRRPGSGRLTCALKTVIRGLRKVQDEQMRTWEAFYRVEPGAPAPKPQPGKSERARAGSDPGRAA